MFSGYCTRALVRFSHRDAECSLSKPWPDQNGRTVTLRFLGRFGFGDAQFTIRLNPRKTFCPNSRSFINIQIVDRVAKIGFRPVTGLRDPLVSREERSIYNDNATDLRNALLRCCPDFTSNFLKSGMHLFKRTASVCRAETIPRQPLWKL